MGLNYFIQKEENMDSDNSWIYTIIAIVLFVLYIAFEIL